MRIVSLVPSWTETLITCGAHIVGRTRYCVHPHDRVQSIPEVGGTKEVNWSAVAQLEPELLVLDREENTQAIAEEAPCPFVATHVKSVGEMPEQLALIANAIAPGAAANMIHDLASRWRAASRLESTNSPLISIPAVIDWIRRPTAQCDQLLYLIWRRPWMSVGKQTFIGSMLAELGFGWSMPDFDEPYPKLELENFDPSRTLLLCSSEPYPFHRKRALVEKLPHAAAIVDGEQFSWFGVRALSLLESRPVTGDEPEK